MKAFEIIGFQATAPGTGPTAATAFAGDSLTVKHSRNPVLMQCWADQQTAGFQQLIWNSGHDTTRNLRYDVPSTEIIHRLPEGVGAPLVEMETIAASISGSATAGDIETGVLMIGYDELPGIAQRLITWPQLLSRRKKLVTVRATITAGTAGGWSGSETIAADSDLLHGNTDYALMGMVVGAEVAAVRVLGPDTGNIGVGMPGRLESEISADYFCRLARAWNAALIPVLNSNNRNSTFITVANDENALSPTVSLLLAQLDR